MKRSFLLSALLILTSWGVIAQAPTISLSATVGTPATSVTVSWDAQPASYSIPGVVDPFMVNGVYVNYRELTSPTSAWVRTALLPRTQTSWVHAGVVGGKTYEYSFQTNVTVGALTYDSPSTPASTAIAGPFNRYATAAVPLIVTPPVSANLQAVLGTSAGSVQLSWASQAGTSVNKIRILNRKGGTGAPWSQSPELASTATSWTHSNLDEFTVYEYSIQFEVPSGSGNVWTPDPAASSAGPNYAQILTPQTPPATPTNLFIDLALTTTTSHNVTWNDNANNENGYEIAYSADGGPFITVRDTSPNATGFFVGGLNPGSNVQVKVRAYNITPDGTIQFSDYSNVAGARTLKSPPAAPISLTEIKTCVNETSFYWSHPNPSEVEEYWVEQSPDGSNWRVHEIVRGYNLGSPYTVRNLPQGEDEYFRIRAINNANTLNNNFKGVGPTTPALRVQALTPAAPPAPFNPRVIIATDAVITFAWDLSYAIDFNCNINNRTATHLRIRVNDGGTRDVVLGPDATTYTISNLPQNAKVELGVYGVNGFYGGLESETVYITGFTEGPPAAPTVFFTSSNLDVFNTPNISMTWTDNSRNEDKFVVEATIDTVAGIGFAVSLAPNVNYYTHIPVDEGVTWYYRSYAENKYGRSGNSNWSFGRVEYSKIPEAPYDLKGRMANGKIFLNWKDDTLREEKFEVERSEDDGTTFAKLGESFRNILTFEDSTMTAGKSYKYRVRAVNPLGASGYTNMVTFTMPAAAQATASIENMISVFPNPVVNTIKVNVPDFISEEGGFVNVYDQNQRLIYRSKLTSQSGEHIFNMSNLKEGMYMVVITTETQKISKKIFKK